MNARTEPRQLECHRLRDGARIHRTFVLRPLGLLLATLLLCVVVFVVIPLLVYAIAGTRSNTDNLCWGPGQEPDTSITLIGRCLEEANRSQYRRK